MSSRSSTTKAPSSASLQRVLTSHAGAVGLGIRLVAAYVLPRFLDDDAAWIPGVAYTDIDYHVFLDAARHLQEGRSPYDRHTYRYTPFLALALSKLPFMRFTARYVFCVADAMCGVLIARLRQQQRRRQRQRQQPPKQEEDDLEQLSDALWWLYNPFAINICTRGSAEALVLLPVLLTIHLLLTIKDELTLHPRRKGASDEESSTSTSRGAAWLWGRVAVAGMWHGLAVHAKLYPVIYTLSYAAFLAPPPPLPTRPTRANAPTCTPNPTTSFSARALWGWVQRLLTPLPILFGVVAVLTFVSLTSLAYVWYGPISLQEGLLYHVGRVDHRHNYSMFWYPIYLTRAAAVHGTASGGPSYLRVASALLFVPQALLLAYVSLGIAPNRLALALFVQTFAFVALNKVITAQYFAWYLVLLPLCSSEFHRGWIRKPTRRRLQVSMAMFVASILVWLGSAYGLEMRGLPVLRHVWAASVLFFAASVSVLGALLAAAAEAAAGNGRDDVDVGSQFEGAQSDAPIQNKVPNKID